MTGWNRSAALGALLVVTALGCEQALESQAAHEAGTQEKSQALIDGPDFVVSVVTGPTSAMPGQSITVQATVCNQGTLADSTNVEVYLSADATIRPPTPPNPPEDSPVGMAPVPYLYPGQCTTVSVSGYANAPYPGGDGAYYVGAVVDPYNSRSELNEANNAKAGDRMGVGNRSDMVVSWVAGPTSAMPGQSITAQVTVCNQGTQGDSTNVEVYLSADANILPPMPPNPPEDSLVGMAPVPYLYPGQCTTVAVSGYANAPYPGGDGAYYLGGVVDPYNSRPELNEANNTRSGYRMGVGNRSDMVVDWVAGPTSAMPGQSITAQVTVCNQGTQGDSTNVEVYLSADANIRPPMPPNPPEDSPVGMVPVPYLYPGQCTTVSVSGYANVPYPGGDGAYYLGAVVDPFNSRPELNEANNARSGYRMGVGNRSDMVVTTVTGPASAMPGQSITVQATVCNQGTQGDSTNVEVYLSADANIRPPTPPGPPEDSPVGMAPVPYLYPGQCTTVAVSGSANVPYPGGEGAYYLGAAVDPFNSRPELIEDNNTKAGDRMGVGNRSDMVVASVTGPASAMPGQSITVQATVCNQGTQGDSTNLEAYLSADANIRPPTPPGPPEDSYVGMVPVPYLNPGQCTTVSLSGYANVPYPGSDGAYYLGVVVDPFNSRPELIEDNNAKAGDRMGVGNRSDMVVTSITGPYSAQHGQAFTSQVTVCNQGTQGDSADVEVYLSADANIRPPTPPGPPEDSYVGMAPVGYLYPGQCKTVSVAGNANVPYPGGDGAYYLGAFVDPYNSRIELIEDNNAKAGPRMGVGNRSDMVVTSVTGPYSVKPGVAFTVNVGVCNRGQLADTTDVELYLSADTNIRAPVPPLPPEDSFLGSVTGVSLAAGACTTRSVSVMAPSVPDGAYYLGGVADPYNSRPELIEDNNSLAGARIGVGYKSELQVNSVTTGIYSVKPGVAFTVNVSVCNRGQQAEVADVEVYLSADTNIRLSGPPLPPEDYYLGTVSGVSLGVGLCASRSLSVTAPSVPDGAYYLGAVVDPYNMRSELIEDNNAKAGTRIGVGYKSDVQVTSVTGPTSARLGTAFSANVTVCNRGQQAEVVDVELYFSADTTIRPPTPPGPPEDYYLGSVTGVSLGVGVCSTRTVTLNANAPTTGSYYLGAAADPFNMRSELIEDNNTRAGTYMSITP
jgi:subtilase family serine protease